MIIACGVDLLAQWEVINNSQKTDEHATQFKEIVKDAKETAITARNQLKVQMDAAECENKRRVVAEATCNLETHLMFQSKKIQRLRGTRLSSEANSPF